MTPRRIGLDFDGVIVDHGGSKIRAAQTLGFSISMAQTSFDGLRSALGEQKHRELQHIIYDDLEYALSSPLMPGALAALDWLRANGWEYYVISKQKAPDIARESMRRHGLWGTHFSDRNVQFVGTSAEKELAAKALSLDTYLDDEPNVLSHLVSVPHRFLFDPIGAYDEGEDYVKVSSWEQFLQHLRG